MMDDIATRLDRIESCMVGIQSLLTAFLQQKAVKDWYSTDEVAAIFGKAEFTVRQWCLHGRIHAQKKGSGRGRYQSWVVSHAELQRFQKEGLLPKN